jgi:hypothetical protein
LSLAKSMILSKLQSGQPSVEKDNFKEVSFFIERREGSVTRLRPDSKNFFLETNFMMAVFI